MRLLLPFLLLVATSLTAQQQTPITLEDIWSTYAFSPDGVSGFNFLQDGTSYAELTDNAVVTYDITTGEPTDTLVQGSSLPTDAGFNGRVDSYTFSDDESKLLISSETEQLFRRSSQSNFFVYDTEDQSFTPVYPEGKIRLATLDPTGENVAFVVDNNVYIRNLEAGDLTQVTEDGEVNAIINGATDWVYEEEFGFSKALYWSPDGERLAFLKFDESAVPEFTYTDFHNDMYPEYNTFKYPKVGEENSTVSLHVYELENGETTDLLTVNGDDSGEWHYIPRVQWTLDDDELTAQRMNRHQNKLELLLFDVDDNEQRSLLTEENKYYVDVTDNLTFLEDGFIWTSEESGFNQLYHYDMEGGKPVPLTSGEYDVTEFYGVHDGRIYFQAAGRDPMQREVYSKSLRGRDLPAPIASERGYNDAQFSGKYDYFVLTNSNINRPARVTVMDETGAEIRTIVTNEALTKRIGQSGFQPAEFFTFTTEEGTELNGYMIKPANMVDSEEHPLLMHVYGGPGSQQVLDNWRGSNMVWFQMLVQKGFVVAVVDNRGTGARGEELKKQTYLTLGKQETEDQISAAKYLGSLDYIDADRIGIFGWSYGGFMALHAILQGNETFAAAIAVAPVTNWKWYDSIYTERYMRTYEENRAGYDENSPINYADRLKGDLLLVHGMGDDNVHFQHTAEMANALIMNNKQFDTYFYPNRNHGIYGGPTRLHLYTKMTNFLMDSLQPSGASK
ncbi:dipeptidyl-peptidase-4 [Neolewinella xylanilytica]|uniref:Dipeptidyl-peptidase-4 n=1 Tax=Neolewinella xylanilytica TaxID=1514080 RepID=A0A2S6I815_9BACT|nr:S9 family peptidase [Neolewinella xylanilytica]PPK87633.1 dipeptidyl-peptidase-4 [Neolewinella xylanilytica]